MPIEDQQTPATKINKTPVLYEIEGCWRPLDVISLMRSFFRYEALTRTSVEWNCQHSFLWISNKLRGVRKVKEIEPLSIRILTKLLPEANVAAEQASTVIVRVSPHFSLKLNRGVVTS